MLGKFPWLALVAIIGWGVWGFMNKLAVGRIHPLAVLFYTFLFNIAFTIPAYLLVKKFKGNLDLNPQGFLFLALALIFAFLASIALVYLLAGNPVSWVIPLTSVYPLITILLAYLFLGERLSPFQWLGAVFVVLGLVCLTR